MRFKRQAEAHTERKLLGRLILKKTTGLTIVFKVTNTNKELYGSLSDQPENNSEQHRKVGNTEVFGFQRLDSYLELKTSYREQGTVSE